jgi:hypothetical protein
MPARRNSNTSRPVPLRTDERRERVLELWGKPDRLVAKILLEEGFDVDGEPRPATRKAQEEWERRRIESMRRNVTNDRNHWLEKWRKRAKQPKNSEELEVELESNIAAIQSDVDDLSELLTGRDVKSSAKAMLYQSKLRARELILRVRGIDKAPEREPENPEKDVPVRPKILIYDISNASEEDKRKYGLHGSKE